MHLLPLALGQQLEHDSVGPAEPPLIRAVAVPDAGLDVRLAPADVVLLDNRAVLLELLGDQAHELPRDPVRVLLEPVPTQALHREQVQRGPAERRVPLTAAL